MRLPLTLALLCSLASAQDWSLLTSGTPSARSGSALIFDHHRDRAVLFGGGDSAGLYDETWEFDGQAWVQIQTALSPAARTGHAMCYDLRRRRVVMTTGGAVGGTTGWETWSYQNGTWQSFATITGSTPSPRSGARMVYDIARDRAVLTGGNVSWVWFGDTWELDGTTWEKITSAGS